MTRVCINFSTFTIATWMLKTHHCLFVNLNHAGLTQLLFIWSMYIFEEKKISMIYN